MLPLHRLAGQQQAGGPLSRAGAHFRAFWSSRLATRVLILLAACTAIVIFLSSPLSSDFKPGFTPFDRGDDQEPARLPPPGHDGSKHTPGSSPAENQPTPIVHKNAALWASRAELVKKSFIHAWDGYEKYAYGYDELLPVSNGSTTNLNGWGVTIVDSLSTMKLMGLDDIYERGMQHVKTLKFKTYAGNIPFFETVIRYLGGLLSAYALTDDPELLRLSDELGATLLPVFKTKSGLPMFGVDPSTGQQSIGWTGASLLAEIASCQMEFKYLAHITGKQEYFRKADKVIDVLEREQWTAKNSGRHPGNGVNEGLFAVRWNTDTGKGIGESATVGALADSGYEYLLKGYLLSGRSEKRLLEMYLKSTRGVLEHMMYLSGTRGLLYVTDVDGPNGLPANRLEHLSCFYGGLLALGVETLAASGDMTMEEAELHRWAAEGLTTTCYLVYAETPSGLGAEEIHFLSPRDSMVRPWMPEVKAWIAAGRKGDVPPGVVRGADAEPRKAEGGTGRASEDRVKHDYWLSSPGYYSRPETLESIYLMWKVTNDEIWRQRGWEIYQSIEKYCKTPAGYASVFNVGQNEPVHSESMPSYFMAETLKYIFLLFTDKDPISFDKWMFNTEAHPLPVFQWSEKEKAAYHIR